MRQLTVKVTTLEQCYVGEGSHDHAGTADLSHTEVGLIQQVCCKSEQRSLCVYPLARTAQPDKLGSLVACGFTLRAASCSRTAARTSCSTYLLF